jgi:hypothetical protein
VELVERRPQAVLVRVVAAAADKHDRAPSHQLSTTGVEATIPFGEPDPLGS